MRILELRALEGRNLYAHFPVMRLDVDLGRECWNSAEIPGFPERLVALLPGLLDHRCGGGFPGGFWERLREGTYPGHVVEHVALELQVAVGWSVSFGKTRALEEPGRYRVVYEYLVKQVGWRAGEAAVALVDAVARGEPYDVGMRLEELRELGRRYGLGPSTEAIVRAARRRDIPVLRLDEGSLLQLGYGCRAIRMIASLTGRASCVAADIAQDKLLVKRLLAEAGIPVPEGEEAGDEQEALAVVGQLGYPVVVKPLDGKQGQGVSLDLRTPQEVAAAFRLAASVSRRVLVERFVPGRHYRVLVVGERAVAAAERLPPRVMGDGRRSVRELIARENEHPWRGVGHEKPLTRLEVDPVVVMCLARQGLTLESVPALGQVVVLRQNANLSTGGTAHDVTEEMHPDNARLAVRAAKVVGLDVAGVDLVAPRLSWPVRPGQGAVIEVNAAPGLRMHLYPQAGKPRDVAAEIVDWLFPPPARGRIPVVAVTGTNGKTTVCRLLAHILAEAGWRVGLATTDGVWVGGIRLREGDCAGPRSARALLGDPEVEAAVLETARGGIIREGLGFDRCQVGVVTNLGSDHLGQEGVRTLEDLASIKSLVLEAVEREGYSVLNFCDPAAALLRDRGRGRRAWFGHRPPREGDPGPGKEEPVLHPREGWLIWRKDGRSRRLVPLASLPVTCGGRVGFAVSNVGAAALAALCLGVDSQIVARALRSFSPLRHNPGRFNIHRFGDRQVVVDYGHNPDALREVAAALRALGASSLGAVIACPGDRPDEAILRVGETAALGFDWLICKEDSDLRGRQPGETARLLAEGARRAGGRKVRVVLDEEEAVKIALDVCPPGGTVVIFYEKYGVVRGALEAWASGGAKEFRVTGENA